ncbi:hypothetical protein B566_EDAN006258 [Ephemera danica]|nr:hypothetical protein B566_EDAN006258 [Ephemera danica]
MTLAFSSARTWPPEVSTSQLWTGLSSMTLQMTPRHIDAVADEYEKLNFQCMVEYIHRVGRTARGEGGRGHALLILRPEELGFLRYLKQARVPLNEFEFSWNKIADIQLQLEKLIGKNYFLNQSAREAYKSYVRSYDSHSLKNIFDVETLDLPQVAKSFGFLAAPAVDLKVNSSKGNRPRKRNGGGGFGAFKRLNRPGTGNDIVRRPKPSASTSKGFDKRQFSR